MRPDFRFVLPAADQSQRNVEPLVTQPPDDRRHTDLTLGAVFQPRDKNNMERRAPHRNRRRKRRFLPDLFDRKHVVDHLQISEIPDGLRKPFLCLAADAHDRVHAPVGRLHLFHRAEIVRVAGRLAVIVVYPGDVHGVRLAFLFGRIT